jgi:hypothetical protein
MKDDGVFVTASGFLADRSGGAQICTREYIATLRAAGINLQLCPYELDGRLSTRIFKKVWPSSYFRPAEQGLVRRVKAAVESSDAGFVFLNQVQLAVTARSLRDVLPARCKIIALSHGLESTDLLHTLRFKTHLPLAYPKYLMGEQLLGNTLLRESSYRSSLDLVLCISPFDVELERWLGAREVEWLPRTVTPNPLSWNPSGNRLGFVGTLDHIPSAEGLILFLRSISAVESSGIRVRVVGGPDRVGRLLMRYFPIVDFLGALSDDDLRREASTWNCFINPIFCLPRGCSTKLATAISWEIPIVTTSSGHRGYTWTRGALAVANTPDKFCELALTMRNREVAQRARAQVSYVAQSSPTTIVVGRRIASLLGVEGSQGGSALQDTLLRVVCNTVEQVENADRL